ncbi:MAG: c-type cytochrome [Thermodesulforhabdaceae bacterium]
MFKKAFLILFFLLLALAFLNIESYGDDPRQLFEKKCNACHSSEKPKSLRKSKQDWEKTVLRMKNKKGSNISDEEAQIIIEFLSNNYGIK